MAAQTLRSAATAVVWNPLAAIFGVFDRLTCSKGMAQALISSMLLHRQPLLDIRKAGKTSVGI